MSAAKSCKVLVVDDERIIAESLVAILEFNGFDAAGAYDADTALAHARDWQPHVVISDIMLPDQDGVALAISLRSELPQCGVILFSGRAAAGKLLESARKRGYDFEVLPKPIAPDELIERIQALCRRPAA
ncbi:MAG: response regulator transcription factor [Terriglobales bacterium]